MEQGRERIYRGGEAERVTTVSVDARERERDWWCAVEAAIQ
jgi:hypothetical protein